MRDSLLESKTKAAAGNTVGLNPELLKLIEQLRKNDPTFRTLYFSKSELGDWFNKSECDDQTRWPDNSLYYRYWFSWLKSNFDDREITVLADALAANHALTYISWTTSNIGDREVIALAGVLATNRALRILNLCNNNIGDRGIIALANALGTNHPLAWLQLDHNNIGDQGIIALANALKTNHALDWLELNHNDIGDPGAIALANVLATQRTLRKLQLAYNRIYAPGAIALAGAIKTNHTLTSLNLNGNKIGYLDSGFFTPTSDSGIVALADAIRTNRTLKYLDFLRSNEIRESGIIAFTDALLTNPTLISFTLDSAIKDEIYSTIKSTWERNESLNAGETCLQRRDYAGALSCFNRFLTSNPNEVRALLGKGNALLGMNRPFPEISAVFKAVLALALTPNEQMMLHKLVQQNPTYLLAKVALPFLTARHLFEQGFYPEAFKALEAAQSAAPESTKRDLLFPYGREILSSAQRVSEAKDQGDEKGEGKEEKQSIATVPPVSPSAPATIGVAASTSLSLSPAVLSDISPELMESMTVYINQLTLIDLERYYVEKRLNFNGLDRYCETFFLRMVQANQLALVKILLGNPKLEIDIQSTTLSGDNALHLAVAGENIGQEMVGLLLKCIVIDSTNHAGHTPLYQAVDSGQSEKIALLLREGANPLHKLKASENAVECAIRKDQVRFLEPLLFRCAQGVSLNIRSTIDKEQLLPLAVSVGAVEVLHYFYLQGANFKIVDSTKRTLLHIAVQATRTQVDIQTVVEKLILLAPELLLEKDNEGNTAEMIATDPRLKALLSNARQNYQRKLGEEEQFPGGMERCSRSIVEKIEKGIGRPYRERVSLSNAILSRLMQDLSLEQRLQVFQNKVLQTALEAQISEALIEIRDTLPYQKEPDNWVSAALDRGGIQRLFSVALDSCSKKEEKTGSVTAVSAAFFSKTSSSGSGSTVSSVSSPAMASTSSSTSTSSREVAKEVKDPAKEERFVRSFSRCFENCYSFAVAIAYHDLVQKPTPEQKTTIEGMRGFFGFMLDTRSAAGAQRFLATMWKNWTEPSYKRIAHLVDPLDPGARSLIAQEAAKKLSIKYAVQLAKLQDPGIDGLACCAVMRVMDYIASNEDALYVSNEGRLKRAVNNAFWPDADKPHRPLAKPVDIIINGVWKGKSKGIWRKESMVPFSLTFEDEIILETKPLPAPSSSPWTGEGVIARSGITVNGLKYVAKGNKQSERYDESTKYGFCEGTEDEVRERGYKEQPENNNVSRLGQ